MAGRTAADKMVEPVAVGRTGIEGALTRTELVVALSAARVEQG